MSYDDYHNIYYLLDYLELEICILCETVYP